MAVRNAREEDVREIRELAESLRFDPRDPKPCALVTVLNEEEYLTRVRESRYFYVSVNDRGLNGFLMCEDDRLVEVLDRSGLFHHQEILPFLAKQGRPFVYGESIGVKEDEQRSRVGTALMNRWFQDMRKEGIHQIYVMVRHSPQRNVSSIEFCKQFGLEYVGEEVAREGMVHGVYGRRFS